MLLERSGRPLRRWTLARQLARDLIRELDDIDGEVLTSKRLTVALPVRVSRAVLLKGRKSEHGFACDVGRPVLVASEEMSLLLSYLDQLRRDAEAEGR